MTRHMWATIVVLAFTNPASANLARLKPQEISNEFRLSITALPTPTAEVAPPQQAELTEETQVFLNGQRSDYKKIPTNATVDRVVLAADGKTIVRIEFTTSK